MKFYLGFLLLLIGCKDAQFTQYEVKPEQPFEEIVSKSLEIFAKSGSNCQEQKLALVRKEKNLIQGLVGQVKEIAVSNPTAIKTKSNHNQFEEVFQILTSEGFKTVVNQTADVIKSIGNSDAIIANLTAIRDDLMLEPGDRIAEIISMLASDPIKQNILLGATHSALCDNLSDQDIIGTLLSPQVMWTLGPNATYLMASPLAKHIKPLILAVKGISLPNELRDFITLAKDMMPKQDICSIENLEAYQKHFALALGLLKTSNNSTEPRPLRSFLNTLFKLYTMEDSNQCAGISFDDLKKENIQNAFFTVSNFLSDEQHGVVGFLNKMQPRQ
jgi:hypothetical protein